MRAVLFDLDGTLLHMDTDGFVRGYFELLAEKAAPYGYEPKALYDAVWKGTAAMVQNDGAMPNRDRFWRAFAAVFGEGVYRHVPVFDDFYTREFAGAVRFTRPEPDKARAAVRRARQAADQVILATNPLFPKAGVLTRLGWLGLGESDFDYITTYENASYCKPNPKYYTELLEKRSLRPRDCLMVGNDVDEDILPAQALGMKTYLVTDCMLNKQDRAFISDSGSLDGVLPAFAG